MTVSKARTWVAGTVLVGVLVVVAAWFLLISPTLAAASDVRSQTEQTDQQNDLLKLQTAKLKANYEKLPELQAKLAAAQQQIPSTEAVQAFLREIDGLAAAHSVQVVTVTPSSAVAYTSSTGQTDSSSATTSTPSETASAPADSSSGATTAPTTATSGAPTGLLQLPVSVSVKGSWSDTAAFLADLQSTGPRLVAVDSVQTAQASGDDSSGLQTLTVAGSIFVLADPTAAGAPAASSTAAPQLPAMAPGANPLSPTN